MALASSMCASQVMPTVSGTLKCQSFENERSGLKAGEAAILQCRCSLQAAVGRRVGVPKYERIVATLKKAFPSCHSWIVGREDNQDAEDLLEVIKKRILTSCLRNLRCYRWKRECLP